MNRTEHTPVLIVGGGFAGIGLAIKLRQAGVGDFLILEREAGFGGTWRINTYPGCACDISTYLYSFSFAPKDDWSRFFATQEEILGYLEELAREHRLHERARFGVELVDARWDDGQAVWTVETSAGTLTADILVSATGFFGAPQTPQIPGLETFEGPAFHSAEWDHDVDMAGKKVAVVGTGASAIQFVPAIQPEVQELRVFQRTPTWILPRFDRPTTRMERRVMRRLPGVQKLARLYIYLLCETLGLVALVSKRFGWAYHALGRWHLRRQVPDPELRRRLTPNFTVGCKRAILSDDWYPALSAPNVDVVDGGIAEVRARSVIADDGTEHDADVIVFGTGFETPQRGVELISGRDGRTLAEAIGPRPQSYKGMTFAGFPNFFLFLGAFSFAGNQSTVYVIEAQIRYIVEAVKAFRGRNLERLEVRAEAQEQFTAEAERRSEGTVWLDGGCRSYYQTPEGRNAGLWPDWSFRYAKATESFDEEAYELVERASRPTLESVGVS